MPTSTRPPLTTLALSTSLLLLAVHPAPAHAQGGVGAGALDYGRRVQVTSPILGPGWHAGVVGYMSQNGQREECPTVFVSIPGPAKGLKIVPLGSITALLVSNRVEKEPPRTAPSSTSRPHTAGDVWTRMAVARLRARYAKCV